MESRNCIPRGYLPGGVFNKFLDTSSGGRWKVENPFSVFYTPDVKTTMKSRRSAPVVLNLSKGFNRQQDQSSSKGFRFCP